ncbi:MAG: NUDIX domain-containing protein [Pseudolabrys sp.]
MAEERAIADRPAQVSVSPAEPVTQGYRPYRRFRASLTGADGETVVQQRDLIIAGRVAAVLPVDLARGEIVLIRQFRLAAHLAGGLGEMIEIVAGRVEEDEAPRDAARRECAEEIGVAPGRMAELFSYLTTPGLTDEQVTVFLAEVDAGKVPARVGNPAEGERIEAFCASIDAVVAALSSGHIRNGPLLVALQWLALNRARLREILDAAPAG